MLTNEQIDKLTKLLNCTFKDLINLGSLLSLIEKHFSSYTISFVKGQHLVRINNFKKDKILTGVSESSLEDAIYQALLKG
jgi:hypothetical protein